MFIAKRRGTPLDPGRIRADRISLTLSGETVLHQASLQANAGEFVGLIGPNGCGKSSLLKCLYRVNRPNSGNILMDDRDLWSISARDCARSIAVLQQASPGAFGLTVRDAISLGNLPHERRLGFGGAEQQNAGVDAMLDLLDIRALQDRPFDRLSGGEQQRVLLARALVQKPRILILDEPTNHLDIRHQWGLLKIVSELGITVVAAIHDLNVAAHFCDRLYLMAEGTILTSGQPEQVLTPDWVRQGFGIDVLADQHPETGRVRLSVIPQTNTTSITRLEEIYA